MCVACVRKIKPCGMFCWKTERSSHKLHCPQKKFYLYSLNHSPGTVIVQALGFSSSEFRAAWHPKSAIQLQACVFYCKSNQDMEIAYLDM